MRTQSASHSALTIRTAFCLLIMLCLQFHAFGAVFYVDDRGDEGDANPGDGLALTEYGVTTLRAAIEEANALPGPDIINMPGGGPRFEWIVDVWGEMRITDDLVIDGDFNGNYGSVLLQQADERLLFIGSTVFVTVRMIGMRQGRCVNGGGVYVSHGASLTLLGGGVGNGNASERGGASTMTTAMSS